MKHHIPASEVIWTALGLDREQYAAQYARELSERNSGSVHAPSDWQATALHNQDRVDATARRMLARYSSARVASEMAGYHACDYGPNTDMRIFWRKVSARIDAIARGQR